MFRYNKHIRKTIQKEKKKQYGTHKIISLMWGKGYPPHKKNRIVVMIFYIKIFFNIYLKEHLQTFFFGGFYGIARDGLESFENFIILERRISEMKGIFREVLQGILRCLLSKRHSRCLLLNKSPVVLKIARRVLVRIIKLFHISEGLDYLCVYKAKNALFAFRH